MSAASSLNPLSFSESGKQVQPGAVDHSGASVAAEEDPLSESLRGSTFFSEDPLAASPAGDTFDEGLSSPQDERFSDRDAQPGRTPRHQHGTAGWAQQGGTGHGVLADGTTRIDTFASYGQLLSPEAYSGSEAGTEEEAAAFGRPQGLWRTSPAESHDSGMLPPASTAALPAAGSQPRQQRISRSGSNNGRAHLSQPGSRPSKRFIRVGDPLKKLEAVTWLGVPKGGYVQFRVESRAEGATETTIVRRRFRDFMALADLLKISHRGYFLPPRPDKGQSPMQDTMPESRFIAGRAATLERWLCQLQAHPVLGVSEELAQFLEAAAPLEDCPQWKALHPHAGGVLNGVARLPRQLLGQEGAVPTPGEAAQPTKVTGDLLRRFKETATTMRNHPPPSDVEQDLQAQRIKAEQWLSVVTDASRAAEALALALEDLDRRTGDLGREITMFAKFQDDDKVAPSRYTAAGTAVASLSSLATKAGQATIVAGRQGLHATKPTTQALQPLHEALAMAPAAIKALKERESALVTAQSLRDEAESKKAAIATLQREGSKVYGSDRGKARKEESLQAEVAALEQAEAAAHDEYQRVLNHNVQELSRWQGHCSARFAFMLRGLAAVRHDTAARSAASWGDAAADLSGRPRSETRDP